MRIILIDNYSGYIWGDSADLDGRPFTTDDLLALRPDANPHDAREWAMGYAQALDMSLGEHDRTYAMGDARSGRSGYHAYRADVRGSDAVPVVHDGQSKDEIEAVERDCESIGFVTIFKDGA